MGYTRELKSREIDQVGKSRGLTMTEKEFMKPNSETGVHHSRYFRVIGGHLEAFRGIGENF